MSDSQRLIIVGRFGAPYGVKGWIKIHSFTDPIDNILTYQPWFVELKGEWKQIKLADSRKHHKGIIVAIIGCENKEGTVFYRNANIGVSREVLPKLPAGEFYWADLENLVVITTAGEKLGTVDYMLATGANDVLVVKGKKEHLIPYLRGDVVKDIDLETKQITVEWDTDF